MKATALTTSTSAAPSLTDVWPTVLHDYQCRGADLILQNPKCELVMKMGFGKTLTTLTALQDIVDRFEVTKVLIVAPKRVAMSVWPAEIEKWGHVNLSYQLLALPKAQREAAVKSDATVHIINIDNLVWLIEYFGKSWPYDMVIIDEASMFKAHGTRRFKMLKRRVADVDRVLLLTGTPSPNGLLDLWPQVFLLDNGQRLFRTISAFRSHYFINPDYQGFKWEPRQGAEEDIYERISDVVFRVEGDIDMPERIDVPVLVDLPTKARHQYEQLEREFLLEQASDDGQIVVTAESAAVLYGRLLQMANGALYHGENKEWLHIHDEKINALKEIEASACGQPVLVAYWYKHDLERLRLAFPHGVDLNDRETTEQDWNAGEIDMMFIHPASGGHGLNLQKAGGVVVWFGLTPSLELTEQLDARLIRQGQINDAVAVHQIVAVGTVDETILEILKVKDGSQKRLIEALQKRANRILAYKTEKSA